MTATQLLEEERAQKYALTIVLGAGASAEVGMPVGTKLITDITQAIGFPSDARGQLSQNEDIPLFHSIAHIASQSFGAIQQYDIELALTRLREGLPLAPSIDNFIDSHKGNPHIAMIGKMAITHCILKAERQSALFVPPEDHRNRVDFSAIGDTWYVSLFKLITQNIELDRLAGQLQRICVVTFNYDRSFEHFMFNAIRAYYGVGEQEAEQLLQNLTVHHAYGKVGDLPWQQQQHGVGYGESRLHHQRVAEVSKEIKTFTEGTSLADSHILAIRNAVRNPTKLLFLGFAFHPLNMQLLYLHDSLRGDSVSHGSTLVFGTAFGLSKSDREITASQLADRGKFWKERIELADLKSADMFRHYSKSLTI